MLFCAIDSCAVVWCAGHELGNVEFIATMNRFVFSDWKTRRLHLVDPESPKLPVQLAAAVNVVPSAVAVDHLTGLGAEAYVPHNSHDRNVYKLLSSWLSAIARVHPAHLMNVD